MIGLKILILLLLLVPNAAKAITLYCKGEVRQSYINSGGDLIVNGTWRDGYTRLCNLKGTANSIDTVTCSLWASYVAAGMTNKKKILVSYTSNSGDTCATLATYNDAPRVSYIMLTHEDVL